MYSKLFNFWFCSQCFWLLSLSTLSASSSSWVWANNIHVPLPNGDHVLTLYYSHYLLAIYYFYFHYPISKLQFFLSNPRPKCFWFCWHAYGLKGSLRSKRDNGKKPFEIITSTPSAVWAVWLLSAQTSCNHLLLGFQFRFRFIYDLLSSQPTTWGCDWMLEWSCWFLNCLLFLITFS